MTFASFSRKCDNAGSRGQRAVQSYRTLRHVGVVSNVVRTRALQMNLRKDHVVGRVISAVLEETYPDPLPPDKHPDWKEWYLRLDNSRLLKLDPDDLGFAVVDDKRLIPATACGNESYGQILTREQLEEQLTGHSIREVVVTDDFFPTLNHVIIVLDCGSHLSNAECEGGNLLFFATRINEEYERQVQYRTFFEESPCDHWGRLIGSTGR